VKEGRDYQKRDPRTDNCLLMVVSASHLRTARVLLCLPLAVILNSPAIAQLDSSAF